MSEAAPAPVVFIHGLWMHATSWDDWSDLFTDSGYQCLTPGWPGDSGTVDETRANAGTLANRGIAEITDHFAKIIADLPVTPVVVGHSFGGLIAQRLHGMGFASGCVAISPAQFKGILRLPLAQLRTAWPVLGHPGLRTKTYAQSPHTFHQGFANGVSREESDQLFQTYAIPAPARPLFQAGFANFAPRSEAAVDTRRERGPLLLIAASVDRTVPEVTVRAAYKIQRKNDGVTEFTLFENRGHSLYADHGWRDVADTALEFLSRNGLSASAPTPTNT